MRSRDPRTSLAIASIFLLAMAMGAWRLARKVPSSGPATPATVYVTLTGAGVEAHWSRKSPAEKYVLDLSLDGRKIFYDTRQAFGEELDATSYRIPESLLAYLDAGQEIQVRLWRIEDGKEPVADEPIRIKVPARFASKGSRSPEERERVANFFRGTSTAMKLSRLPARGDRSEPRDSSGPAWLDDEIVVTFKKGKIPAREEVDRIGFPIERVRFFSGDEAFRLHLSPTGEVTAAMKRLKELGAVIRAQPNLVFHSCDLNVRERELPLRQYAPQRVKASFVWQRDFGGDGVIVGVVDTGLNGAPGSGTTTHKEFDGVPDYSYPNWSAVGTPYPQGIWIDYGTVIRPSGSDLLFACITDPNGLAGGYKGSEPTWPATIGAKVYDVYPAWPGAGQPVALNAKIKPTTSNFVFLCIQAGTTGSSQPSWPGSIGGQVNDGTARWEAVSYPVQWEAIVEYYGFRPKILPKVMYGPNFIGATWNAPPNANIYPNDGYGHGTHTAGIIGAEDDGDKLDWFANGGIAGIAPRCTILPVKSVDDNGYATSITICQGIDYAAHYGARVIYVGAASSVYANLSDVAQIDMMETASVNYALSRGAVVVAPMGNDRSSLPTYPACIQGVIAVGATMGNEKPGESSALASFSNNGPWMSVVAPGVSIYSADSYYGNPGDYVMWTGTSQAAAVVAGVCALIAERYPAMSPAEIKRRLETTAVDLGPAGHDPFYGWGCVDAAAAVATSSSDISDLLAYTPGRVVHFEYIEEMVWGDWSASKLIIRFNEDMNTEDVTNLAYYDLYMDAADSAGYTAYNLATWASGSVTATYSNRVLTISNISDRYFSFKPSKPRQPVAIRVSRNVRTAAGDYPMNTSEGQGGSESYFTIWQTSTSETDQYLPGTSTAPFKPRIPTCYGHVYGYTYENGTKGGIKIQFAEPIHADDAVNRYYYKCYANPIARPQIPDVLVSESELASGATEVDIFSRFWLDRTTQGTWKGKYGSEGWWIAASGDPYKNLPAYANVTFSTGVGLTQGVASTTETWAVQKPDPATDRVGAYWYKAWTFDVNVTINDGKTHQVSFYLVDWNQYSARRHKVEVVDPSSGNVLATANLDWELWKNGVYVVCNLQGQKIIRFTLTSSGAGGWTSTYVNAMFFDPGPSFGGESNAVYSYDSTTRMLTISGITDPNFLNAKTFAVKLKGQTVNFGGRPTWQPNTNYSIDDEVIPTAPSRFYYKAISDAGSSGGSEPTWPEMPGFTVDDSGITWECLEAPRSGLRHASATNADGTPVNYLRGDYDVDTPSSWGLNPLYGSIAAASPGDPPKITWVGNYGYRLGNYNPSAGTYPQTYGAVSDQIEVRFNRPIDSFSARNAGYWSLLVGGSPVDVKSCSVLFDDKGCNASSYGPTRLWLVGVDLRGYAGGTPITVTCESAKVLAQNGDPIVTPNNTCSGTIIAATASTNKPRWAVADSSGASAYTGTMTIHFGPGPRLDPVTAENPANYTVQCSTLPTGAGDAVTGPSYAVYDQESNTVKLFGLTRASASYWAPGNYARVSVSSNVKTDQGQSAAGALGDHSQSQPIILIGRANSYAPSQSGGNAKSFYDPGDRKTARLASCAPAGAGVSAAGGVLRLTSPGGTTNWVALRATDGSGGPASFLFNNTTFEGLDYEVDIHGPPANGTYTRIYFLGGQASGTGAHPANYNGPALELRAQYNSGTLSFQVRGKSSGTGEPGLLGSSGPTSFVSGAKLHFRVDASNWYVFYNNASVGSGAHTLAASFAATGAYVYLMYEGAGSTSSTGLYDDIYVSRRIRSAANGNWASPATWNPPVVPEDYDNVSIRNSVAVTDIGSCRNLALEGVQSLSVPLVEADNDISAMYFVLSRSRIMVLEGGSNVFGVKLSADPGSGNTVTASVTATSSGCSLSVNPPSLTFTGGSGGTWKDYQTVTVSAAEDADTTCGTGTITITRTAGPGPTAPVTVSANEADNDVVSLYVDPIDVRVPEGEETAVKVRLSRDPGATKDVLFNAVTGGDADIKIGFPDATRTDPNIDFAAPFTPPLPVPNVNFSVRWTGKLNIPASGDWQFHSRAADGVRLWIKDDGGKWAPIIMDWNFAAGAPRDAYGPVDELNQLTTIALSAGYHDFRMEYFRGNDVPAEVHLRWTGPGTSDQTIPAANFRLPDDSGPGLKGDYYSNTNLSTTPNSCDAVRVDPQIAFDFVATPSPVGSTNLSVRWTGWIRPAETGEYTFFTRSDDGVRLWVNGLQLVNNWTYHGDTLNTGSPKLNLTAGQDYSVKLEYMQGTGASLIRLEWQKTGWSSRVLVPESCLLVPDKSQNGVKGEYFKNETLTPRGYGLTFDTAHPWNVAQDMRFYAEEDGDWSNGTASFTVACSGAANTGLTISASEVDNDDPPITFVTSTDVVRALEGDAAGKSFKVRLSRAPSYNVEATIARTSGDTDISVSSGGTLTFTPANWNVDQTVTVVAAEDGDDFNGSAVITLSGRGVGGQVSVTSKNLTAWEVDNDSVQIYTDPDTVTAVEQGAGQPLNVRLSKQPAANVVVSQAVSNQSNCSFSAAPASLTFTTANWSTPQAFTVTAGDDANAVSGTATLSLTSTAGGGSLTMSGERATLLVQGLWDDARGTFNQAGGQVWLRGSPSGTDVGLPIVHKTSNRFKTLVIDPWPQVADYTVTTSLAAWDIHTMGGTTLRCPGGNIYIYGVFKAMGELVLGGGSRIHLNMPGGNGFPNSYLDVTGPSAMLRTEGTTGFQTGGYATIGAYDTTTAWVRLAGGVDVNYVYFRRLYWDYYNTTSRGLQLDGAYDATRNLRNAAFNSEGASVSDSPTAYIYIRSSKWNNAVIRNPQFYKAPGWQDPYKAIAAVSGFSGCKLYIEDYILGGTGAGRYPGAINRLLYENPPATDPHASGDYLYTADSITTWYHWRYGHIGSRQGVIQWRNPISPTPVGITSFQATAEPDGTVRLSWATGAERDNAAFRIYRLCDGAEERAAEVRGAVSSAEPREYAFVDVTAPPGRKVQYKLVSVTTGGDENIEGAAEVETPAVPVKAASAAAAASASDPSAGAAPASAGGSGVPTIRPVPGRTASKYAAAGSPSAGRLPEGEAARIECRSEGPCFVPAAELPGGIALSRSLLHGGSKAPVLARTTVGGRRGLLFFARKDPSLYSDSSVYWMRASRGAKPKAPRLAFAKGAPEVATYTASSRAEEDEFFFGNPYIEDARDSWYFGAGRQLSSDGAPFRVTLQASDKVDGEAVLRIGLASYTESPDVSPDHAAEVRVNGTLVARLEWDGKRYAEFEVPVPDWLLADGDNEIDLRGIQVDGVAFSWSFMDYVELSYRRVLRAQNGMLDAWVEAPAGSRLVVSGITDPKPWVIDATEKGNERLLRYKKEKDGDGWKIVVPAPGGKRRIVVCERSAAAAPAEVEVTTIRRIGRADYVMVVPEGWKEAAGVRALAAHHSARGLKVAVVTPRECCDLTGARSVGPEGIRAYLKEAGARYAVLVGDTHYDCLHRTTGRETLVPTFLVHTWELGDIPTDAPFADADCDGRPDVAVGRLPAVDASEMAVMAEKVVSASAGNAAATVVADGEAMFESGADALAASVSEGAPVKVLRAASDGAAKCREEVLEAIARGDRLVAYVGHASIDRLGKSAPILSAADAAEMTGSGGGVLLGATCVINYFGGTSAGHRCLGEALVKAPGGPAAVVGSAGFTVSPMQDELANLVASYLLGPGGRSSAVGDALIKAKRDLLGRSDARYRSREFADVMRAYMVLGDPAYVPGNGSSGR